MTSIRDTVILHNLPALRVTIEAAGDSHVQSVHACCRRKNLRQPLERRRNGTYRDDAGLNSEQLHGSRQHFRLVIALHRARASGLAHSASQLRITGQSL